MSTSFLTQLIPVGSRSSGASTSMLRLPSRNISHTFSQFAPTTLAAYATFASTAPRRWQHNKEPDRHGRIDQVEHIPTTFLGRALLTAGSALGLLNNPSRGDLLSMLTQVSSGASLAHLLESMRSTESGRRLLIERPSVNSETVDVDYLASLERGKFGREWIEWLKENGVGPDGRAEADYMSTSEHKYLIQRYRESHDFYHLLLRMPVTQLGETIVKYFEMAQMNMPVAGFAAAGGTLRILASNLSSLPKPSQLVSAALNSSPAAAAAPIDSADLAALQTLIPWAMQVGRTSAPLISIEWERCWERDINDMRLELGITRPPIQIAKFSGRAKKVAKRRGWPSKILQHQKVKQQQQQTRTMDKPTSTVSD
ncbi:related to COQ4 - responsible for restoring ubiquinone biosynthesis in coq4 mutant [Ustilago trichophora]|uniref:4-hydroxy-3-methoxy-5-polyprenylbenzoate decarboxylase n=1 Tax=Ustilago trichophora TaxID=86804 RepID=A0A5C3EMR5_9BASI|nr:related to COQ4 - responsible for restoring ubiquinone biosynthesis in coq4 mutant [Ustilago trichophora]